MDVKILQGQNHKNPTTTIIISDEKRLNHEQIERVIKIHPLFGQLKNQSDKEVEILSELPHLWKEIIKVLNDTDAKEKIDEIINRQLLSMSTIPILYKATQMGYEITQFYLREGVIKENGKANNRYYCIGHGCQSEIAVSVSSSQDSYLAVKTQRDKWLTNATIERLGLPIPKWELINSKDDIEELFRKYEKPFVIKPTGLTGGHGVTTGIDTLQKAYKAYDMAIDSINTKERSQWQRKVMIQDQVKSAGNEDYRLLVIGGRLEVATKRIPANIIGDGKSTIKELIAKTNQDPRRDITNPTHILKPIVIDEMLSLYLQEQGLSLESVPAKNQTIYVRKTASMSQGGITEDVTDKVHPQIRYIVETIASSLHAFTMGADIMCLDIGKPLSNDNGAILEVNTMPESYLNIYPVIGESREYVLENYIKGLIGHKKKCPVIVIIGEIKNIHDVLEKANYDGKERVGVLYYDSIYINDMLINDSQEIWSAVESLKVNASLDKIVLVYKNEEVVKEYGMGFNNIDKILHEKA